MPETTRTGSDAFLEALASQGVEYVFANLGTDHAGIVESYAKHQEAGSAPVPKLVLGMHENVAMHAALGYAQVTGRAQAVFVHVDMGTINVGVGMHNASRTRIPVLVFAGIAPWTEYGERVGTRDSPVHWVQNVYDQAGCVREYVKWEYEMRSGINIAASVARGLQIAHAAPAGPVYLTAAREPLEEPVPDGGPVFRLTTPVPSIPAPAELERVVTALRSARRPLILTSAAGRTAAAVEALVEFAETFAIPVVEVRQAYMNMPTDHPLHLGWTPGDLLEQADLVLCVECDIPWVPSKSKPSSEATIVWLGADPLGSHIPMRSHAADIVLAGDLAATLRALSDGGRSHPPSDPEALTARFRELSDRHDRQRAQWSVAGNEGPKLTGANVCRLVAEITGDHSIIVPESVRNALPMYQQLRRRIPGTILDNLGSGLGMALPAAFGAKLARPDADVVAIVGDGSYMFGPPAATHWSADAYGAPFMTVVLNNGAWQAVIDSTLSVHPRGYAYQQGVPQARFQRPPKLSRVVSVVDGIGYEVHTVDEAAQALEDGLKQVRQGKSVVIDARLSG